LIVFCIIKVVLDWKLVNSLLNTGFNSHHFNSPAQLKSLVITAISNKHSSSVSSSWCNRSHAVAQTYNR